MVSRDRGGLSADFWTFWTGQTLSNLGSSFSMFALPLLVYQLTHSAVSLAITSASEFLPYLLFGLVIGAWLDRVDRKRLMIATDLARALVIAAIPALSLTGHLSVWWIYGLGFVSSTLGICFDAGQFAAIPSLVRQDDLVTANGRIQASYAAATVAGPLLATPLVTVLPLPTVLLIDALSFLVSALTLASIRKSFNAAERRDWTSLRHDIAEGLRYVLGHPVLRNISAMMALVNFFGSTATFQLVLFAKRQLGATNAQVALLYAAGSVGVVALGLVAGRLRKHFPFSRVALTALMLDGLLIVLLSFMRVYWVAVPIWALASGVGVLFNINTGSLRQAIVPSHLLGRVMSIAGVLAWSAIPLGTLLGGVAIERTANVALVYGVIGAATFLIPVAFSFTALGHAERYLPERDEGTTPEPVAAG